MRLACALSVLLPLAAAAAELCETPRLRDTAALAMAISQDKQVAQAFQKAAALCGKDTEACDQARLECGTLLSSTLKNQVGFDEGAWLRDMFLPYQGQRYVMSQSFVAGASATDTACTGEPAVLTAAANRRLAQAAKRQAIFDEYPRYAKWVTAASVACQAQASADQQREMASRTEAERLAAAALAAKAAEEARQRAEDDAKKRAEAEAKARAEHEKKTREAQLAQMKQQQDATEAAQRRAEEEARQRAKSDEEHRRASEEAIEEAKRERRAAEEKAQRLADERAIKERENRANQLRQQKTQLVADAEAEVRRTTADAEKKQRAAMEALEEKSPAASMLASEAAAAERLRVDAERRLQDAKVKAERIDVDDSFERSRGSLSALGSVGFTAMSNSEGESSGIIVGGQAGLHLGFWGTAPVDAMASGLEIRVLGRYLQMVGGTGAQRWGEGQGTLRWFFSRIGIGAVGEYRFIDTTVGNVGRSHAVFGLGPSLGVALVDTPTLRLMINANWVPVVSNDLLRVVGDIDMQYRYFTVNIAAGTTTDVSRDPARVGFFVGASFGVRFGW